MNSRGRIGLIIPTAIATGDTTSTFFSDLVISGQLVSLRDFVEARDFFQGLESRDPFCLFTLKGKQAQSSRVSVFTFQMLSASEIKDPSREIELRPEDFTLFNPNTQNSP